MNKTSKWWPALLLVAALLFGVAILVTVLYITDQASGGGSFNQDVGPRCAVSACP